MFGKLKDNLSELGYSNDHYTINNEIQSYLRGNWNHPDFSKGINLNELKRVRKQFLKDVTRPNVTQEKRV